jgi:hypothetical protein
MAPRELTERQHMWLHSRGGRKASEVVWLRCKPFVRMFHIKKKKGVPQELWVRSMALVRIPDDDYLDQNFIFKKDGIHTLIVSV